ncbi:MAG: cell envelope integrity protein TolA [Cyanobacteria bacterium P01_F01_bin.143]
MSNSVNLSEDKTQSYYPSLASFREAHRELLLRHRQTAFGSELADNIATFIIQGTATGVLLDEEEDRWVAQGILDYWLSVLYSENINPPDASLAEFDIKLAPELPDEDCPYLGLEAFLEKDRQLFFGRSRLLKQLLEKIKKSNLLTVVGSSGSGKSSAVRGGLLPSLKANALENSSSWHYYKPLVPGSDPLCALAKTICPENLEREQWCAEQVAAFLENTQHLAQLVSDNHQQPVVLVIDQFEEVFSLCDDGKRQAFIANLLGLIQLPERKHRVIITMRSDFESNVAKFAKFQEAFEQAQVRVLGLNANELRDAIEKPADQVGLKFESDLVDSLIGDVLGQEAALPLLQFTLLKLWDNRERNRVTWASYQKLGGGKEALSRSADEFYQQLIPEDQNATRRILLQLVNFNEESLEVTSKRIPQQNLFLSGEAGDRIQRVIDKLHAARLVKIALGDSLQDGQIEVAHEALIRNWGTLVDWIDDERENKRQRLRLESKAKEWQSRGKTKDALLRGSLLEDAMKYSNLDLNDLEKEFIKRSIRSQNKTKNLLLAISTLVTLALSILSIWAVHARIIATQKAVEANIARKELEIAFQQEEEAREQALEARKELEIALQQEEEARKQLSQAIEEIKIAQQEVQLAQQAEAEQRALAKEAQIKAIEELETAQQEAKLAQQAEAEQRALAEKIQKENQELRRQLYQLLN